MADILSKIVDTKHIELQGCDYTVMQREAELVTRSIVSMSSSIRNKKGGIIAEFKRRSPSKGWINEQAEVEDIVTGYEEAGAAAASILTDRDYFGGDIEFLKRARLATATLPLLRKEFIIDKYQVYEARVAGADAILLIAACLTQQECYELAKTANSVGLEVLLELHTESELNHINKYVQMVGVNNRNLGTFVTDIENSYKLADAIKVAAPNAVLVSESGIDAPQTIKGLQGVGYNGFLMGEAFMKTDSPAQSLKTLISEL